MNNPELFLQKTGAAEILETMLNKAQRADELYICSFAMAEGFARRLVKEKANNRIAKLNIILDFTVATRNRANMLFIANIADNLYLTNTHAKLMLIESPKYSAVCTLSANATMNHRFECGIITSHKPLIASAKQQLKTMITESVRIE